MALSQRLQHTCYALIASLADEMTTAALDTSGQGARPEVTVAAFRDLLKAYEAAIRAVASSPTYALRDLPGGEQDAYERAQHALKILEALYAPKAAAEKSPDKGDPERPRAFAPRGNV